MKKTGLADSPFFRSPTPLPETESQDTGEIQATTRSSERPNESQVRTSVRVFDRSTPPRRSIKRHSFEIYEDQLATLKRLKGEAMLKDQDFSMSAMVRDALDKYFQEQN
jgi:hypothetical protein